MATNTTNYNLIKPAPEDFYNIAEFNSNMDKIDDTLKAKADLENGKVKESQLPDGIADHLAQTVSDTNGAHGLRCVGDDTLERYDKPTSKWIPVAVGAPKLQTLVITTPPTKTTYRAGETFVADGMIVTANYSQSASAPVTGYKITPSGPLSSANTYVTISYTENGITKTVQQPITVAELSRIDITTPPTKTAYVYGDYFDPAGMVVRATFSDGSTENVTAKITYSPLSALALSNTAVTISYTENGIIKTTTQAIIVTKRLTSIAITTPPTKTEYTEGETFSAAGMVVRGYYNDGTYNAVTEYTYSPAGALTTGDTTVNLTYIENGVTMTATQAITVKPNISNTLNNNSWTDIAEVAAAGKAQAYWSIGDTKDERLTTGEVLTFQIWDFDHDDLADGSEKVPITFGMKNLMADQRSMNATGNGNTGGWASSALYKELSETVYNTFSEELKTAIKIVIKKTGCGTAAPNSVLTQNVTLFLPAHIECYGTSSNTAPGEGTRYPIFTDNASRTKALSNGGGVNAKWLNRSPTNTYSGNNYNAVQTDGNWFGNALCSESFGICFGFCI